jgi:hypothetical protein
MDGPIEPVRVSAVRAALLAIPGGVLGGLACLGFSNLHGEMLRLERWEPTGVAVLACLAWLPRLAVLRKGHQPGGFLLGVLGRVGDLGAAMAAGILLAILAVRIPPIRHALTLWDHHHLVSAYASRGRIGLASRTDLYSKEYGVELLLDPGIVEARTRLAAAGWQDTIKDRSAWSLLFAAHRWQGRSPDAILGLPAGRSLALGAILAETYPPCWVSGGSWILECLDCRPSGESRLGMVEAAWARARVEQFSSAASTLTTDQAGALLSLVQDREGLITPAAMDRLLHRWRDGRPEFAAAIDATCQMRSQLRNILAGDAVALQLKYPASFRPEVQTAYQRAVFRLVRSAGFRPVVGTAVTAEVRIEPREYRSMTYGSYTWIERKTQEPVHESRYVPGGHGVHNTTRYREATHFEKSTTTAVGPLRVAMPVLHISVGGKTVALESLPCGEVPKNRSDLVLQYLGRTDLTDSTLRIFHDDYLTRYALLAWRYGVDEVPERTAWDACDD